MGNSYNAQCWAEARAHARDYTTQVVARHPDIAPLSEASEAFGDVASALGEVASLFPFCFEKDPVENDATIEEAVGHLRLAHEAEVRALGALREAIAAWPPEEGA